MGMNCNHKRREFLVSTSGFAALSLLGVSHGGQEGSPPLDRRVVTGLNELGKSAIVSDGAVPAAARYSELGKASGSDLWLEKVVPVDNADKTDPMADYSLQAWPPSGGVIFRTATWEPGFSYPMHRSDTVDFFFVISGRLELILEDGSTILESGDSVVQRGTNHAWRVVGPDPCRFAAVLVSAVS